MASGTHSTVKSSYRTWNRLIRVYISDQSVRPQEGLLERGAVVGPAEGQGGLLPAVSGVVGHCRQGNQPQQRWDEDDFALYVNC